MGVIAVIGVKAIAREMLANIIDIPNLPAISGSRKKKTRGTGICWNKKLEFWKFKIYCKCRQLTNFNEFKLNAV